MCIYHCRPLPAVVAGGGAAVQGQVHTLEGGLTPSPGSSSDTAAAANITILTTCSGLPSALSCIPTVATLITSPCCRFLLLALLLLLLLLVTPHLPLVSLITPRCGAPFRCHCSKRAREFSAVCTEGGQNKSPPYSPFHAQPCFARCTCQRSSIRKPTPVFLVRLLCTLLSIHSVGTLVLVVQGGVVRQGKGGWGHGQVLDLLNLCCSWGAGDEPICRCAHGLRRAFPSAQSCRQQLITTRGCRRTCVILSAEEAQVTGGLLRTEGGACGRQVCVCHHQILGAAAGRMPRSSGAADKHAAGQPQICRSSAGCEGQAGAVLPGMKVVQRRTPDGKYRSAWSLQVAGG
mmetsp:Transcript_22694/g.59272  ORF Transcript_22694/g.59272 Transcript_22694/m.59272 type:complete len:346 (-) Transcript_22694:181-1218(-)